MKQLVSLILLSFTVGIDGFVIAITIGMSRISKVARLKVVITLSLIETLITLLGVIAGGRLASSIGAEASKIGGSLLIATAIYQIVSAIRDNKDGKSLVKTGWRTLLITGIAVSLDNLVIGFGLGTLGTSLLLTVVVMAAVSIGLTILGLEIGRRISNNIGDYSEYLAGLLLAIVGAAILAKLL